MRVSRTVVIVGALLVVALPALAKENRSGAGIAYTVGTVDADSFVSEVDFVGFTVFWKQGFNDRWGLLVSYRDMEDDEDLLFGEEDKYQQLAVHAVVMWRHGKQVRPHVKFGLANTDAEASAPGFPTITDDDTTLSVGGGLEAGSNRIAFFADWDFTQPELFLEDNDIGNLSLGIIFKY